MSESLGTLIAKLGADVADLKKGLADGRKELSGFKSMAEDVSDSVSSALSFVGIGAAIAAVFAGLKSGLQAGIQGIESFNQATIGIASQLTNIAAEGQGSFKEMFERNLGFARNYYDELRKFDAERASSLEEMMTVYKAMVTEGYQARLDEAQAISLITDLIKQKTAGQSFEIQAYQEIRSLLSGQADQHSRIAQDLKSRLGPAWADIIKSHKEAGTLTKFLVDMYPGIAASSEQIQRTLEAQNTTLKSQLTFIGRSGLAGMYDYIVDTMQRINNYLKEHANELSGTIANNWKTIQGAVDGMLYKLGQAGKALIDFSKQLEKISQDPFVMALFGAAAGSRLGPWGALVGGAAGAFKAADNIKSAAQERVYQGEFGGYETGMREQMQEPSMKEAFPATQTEGKQIDQIAKAVQEGSKEGIQKAIEQAANKYKIDPKVLLAMAQQESGLDQSAISPKGARGIMQLMPGTAAGLGVNPSDPMQNIEGGAKYLRQMIDMFGGDIYKAVAAYNAGPGNVQKWFGSGAFDISKVTFKETRGYLASVFGKGRGYGDMEKGFSDAERDAKRQAKEEAKVHDYTRLIEKELKDQLALEESKLDQEIKLLEANQAEKKSLLEKEFYGGKISGEQYYAVLAAMENEAHAKHMALINAKIEAEKKLYPAQLAGIGQSEKLTAEAKALEISSLRLSYERRMGVLENDLRVQGVGHEKKLADLLREQTEWRERIADLMAQAAEDNALGPIAEKEAEINRYLRDRQKLRAQIPAELQDQFDTDTGTGVWKKTVGEEISGWASTIANGFKNLTDTIADGAADMKQALNGFFKSLFSESLEKGFKQLTQWITDALSQMFSSIGSGFGGAIMGAIGLIGMMLTSGGGGSSWSASGASTGFTSTNTALRGIIAGETSIPIAQIGESLRDALVPSEHYLALIAKNTGVMANGFTVSLNTSGIGDAIRSALEEYFRQELVMGAR